MIPNQHPIHSQIPPNMYIQQSQQQQQQQQQQYANSTSQHHSQQVHQNFHQQVNSSDQLLGMQSYQKVPYKDTMKNDINDPSMNQMHHPQYQMGYQQQQQQIIQQQQPQQQQQQQQPRIQATQQQQQQVQHEYPKMTNSYIKPLATNNQSNEIMHSQFPPFMRQSSVPQIDESKQRINTIAYQQNPYPISQPQMQQQNMSQSIPQNRPQFQPQQHQLQQPQQQQQYSQIQKEQSSSQVTLNFSHIQMKGPQQQIGPNQSSQDMLFQQQSQNRHNYNPNMIQLSQPNVHQQQQSQQQVQHQHQKNTMNESNQQQYTSKVSIPIIQQQSQEYPMNYQNRQQLTSSTAAAIVVAPSYPYNNSSSSNNNINMNNTNQQWQQPENEYPYQQQKQQQTQQAVAQSPMINLRVQPNIQQTGVAATSVAPGQIQLQKNPSFMHQQSVQDQHSYTGHKSVIQLEERSTTTVIPQQQYRSQGFPGQSFQKGKPFDIKKFDSVLDPTNIPQLFSFTKEKSDLINSSLPKGYSIQLFSVNDLKFDPVIYGTNASGQGQSYQQQDSSSDYGETPTKKFKPEESSSLFQLNLAQLPVNGPMKREISQLIKQPTILSAKKQLPANIPKPLSISDVSKQTSNIKGNLISPKAQQDPLESLAKIRSNEPNQIPSQMQQNINRPTNVLNMQPQSTSEPLNRLEALPQQPTMVIAPLNQMRPEITQQPPLVIQNPSIIPATYNNDKNIQPVLQQQQHQLQPVQQIIQPTQLQQQEPLKSLQTLQQQQSQLQQPQQDQLQIPQQNIQKHQQQQPLENQQQQQQEQQLLKLKQQEQKEENIQQQEVKLQEARKTNIDIIQPLEIAIPNSKEPIKIDQQDPQLNQQEPVEVKNEEEINSDLVEQPQQQQQQEPIQIKQTEEKVKFEQEKSSMIVEEVSDAIVDESAENGIKPEDNLVQNDTEMKLEEINPGSDPKQEPETIQETKSLVIQLTQKQESSLVSNEQNCLSQSNHIQQEQILSSQQHTNQQNESIQVVPTSEIVSEIKDECDINNNNPNEDNCIVEEVANDPQNNKIDIASCHPSLDNKPLKNPEIFTPDEIGEQKKQIDLQDTNPKGEFLKIIIPETNLAQINTQKSPNKQNIIILNPPLPQQQIDIKSEQTSSIKETNSFGFQIPLETPSSTKVTLFQKHDSAKFEDIQQQNTQNSIVVPQTGGNQPLSITTPPFLIKLPLPPNIIKTEQEDKQQPFGRISEELQKGIAVEQVHKGTSENSLILILPPSSQFDQNNSAIDNGNKIEIGGGGQGNIINLNQTQWSRTGKRAKIEKKEVSPEDKKIMSEIIYRLMKNKNSEPFKRSGAPNSGGRNSNRDSILDLSTVENNIKKSYYGNIDEMATDVYKIFEQAKLVHKEDSETYKKASELEEYFKKKYQKTPLSNDINNLQKKVDKLGKELKEYHMYGGRYFYRENKKVHKQAFMERQLTLEEKITLMNNLRKLPKEYMIGVWEIMTDKQFCIADRQKIEFDIDTAPPKLCRRIDRYIKTKLATVNKSRERKRKKNEKKNKGSLEDQMSLEELCTDSSYITDSDDSMKDPDEENGDV